MKPRLLLVTSAFLALSCSRPMALPAPLDASTWASTSQAHQCGASTRGGLLPRVRMSLAPGPDEIQSQPHPPADLLAQRDELAACLTPGEELALEMREGQLAPLCQAARPEALTCLRERLAPLAEPAFPFLLRGRTPEPDARAEAYSAAFSQHMPDLRDCYRGILTFRPDAKGLVVLTFFVGTSGAVEGTDVLQNDTGAPELACCLENKLSQYRFPPGGCATHVVRIPFAK